MKLQDMKMNLIDWDRYIVHENGDVFDKKINRLLNHLPTRGGYYQIFMSGQKHYIHRIVAYKFLFNDNPKIKKEVNHIDFNKSNNHKDNLEWCSRTFNVRHANNTGRGAIKKLSFNDAQVIRELYQSKKISQESIAKIYSVSSTTIHRVVTGCTYKTKFNKYTVS